MPRPDTSSWISLGQTTNSHFYLIEPNVLALVPKPGSSDTEDTARENLGFEHGYFREHGAGVVLVFIEGAMSQDSGARKVYVNEADPTLFLGGALIGQSLLARAIGSFFLGLNRMRVPFKMTGSSDQALAWAREVLRKHAAARSEQT
jgi:hypothetical protein